MKRQSLLIACLGCKELVFRGCKRCPRCGLAEFASCEERPKKPRLIEPAKNPRISIPFAVNSSVSYVYLITDGAFCKIGHTGNLQQRLQNLQNATPHDLSLVDAVETSEPMALEAFLHGLFASKHHRLEWFKHISMAEWRSKVATAQSLLIEQSLLNTDTSELTG